jgi:hypothetical protein
MVKIFVYRCPKHGQVRIEVEKPPIRLQYAAFCPFCLDRLSKEKQQEEKQVKWQACDQ